MHGCKPLHALGKKHAATSSLLSVCVCVCTDTGKRMPMYLNKTRLHTMYNGRDARVRFRKTFSRCHKQT